MDGLLANGEGTGERPTSKHGRTPSAMPCCASEPTSSKVARRCRLRTPQRTPLRRQRTVHAQHRRASKTTTTLLGKGTLRRSNFEDQEGQRDCIVVRLHPGNGVRRGWRARWVAHDGRDATRERRIRQPESGKRLTAQGRLSSRRCFGQSCSRIHLRIPARCRKC